jgi:hypothetical protein
MLETSQYVASLMVTMTQTKGIPIRIMSTSIKRQEQANSPEHALCDCIHELMIFLATSNSTIPPLMGIQVHFKTVTVTKDQSATNNKEDDRVQRHGYEGSQEDLRCISSDLTTE